MRLTYDTNHSNKHLAGVKLQGDYQDLNALYDALMRWLSYYNEYTDILSDSSYEYLLALNYDIRHAFQGTREILAVGNNLENYDLISASTTPDVTLTTEQKKAVRNLKKQLNIAGYFEPPVRPSRATVPVGVEP